MAVSCRSLHSRPWCNKGPAGTRTTIDPVAAADRLNITGLCCLFFGFAFDCKYSQMRRRSLEDIILTTWFWVFCCFPFWQHSFECATQCYITTRGTLKCVGWNNVGQLGDGTKSNRLFPVPLLRYAISRSDSSTV